MEENSKEFVQLQFKIALDHLNFLISKVEDLNFTNEQWFLNVMDELNKLSIKY